MYIGTLSKSQVSEVPHVARFPLRTWRQYSEPSKSEKQTLVANSTAFAWHLARLAILHLCTEGTWKETSLTRHYGGRNPRLHSVPVNPKSKKNVFTLASGRQKRHLSPCLYFGCTNNRIIISFLCVRKFRVRKLASSAKKKGAYKLIRCTNC